MSNERMTTWRKLIGSHLDACGESYDDVIASTLSEAELDVEFNCGFGGSEGIPFTLWTRERVYFPLVYDGAEWVGSASRYPDGKPTSHQGGE